MSITEYINIIEEIERMSNIYKRVKDEIARKSYGQYVDLIIEQLDFSFEEKSDLRKYWRNLVRWKRNLVTEKKESSQMALLK